MMGHVAQSGLHQWALKIKAKTKNIEKDWELVEELCHEDDVLISAHLFEISSRWMHYMKREESVLLAYHGLWV